MFTSEQVHDAIDECLAALGGLDDNCTLNEYADSLGFDRAMTVVLTGSFIRGITRELPVEAHIPFSMLMGIDLGQRLHRQRVLAARDGIG